MIRINLLPYRAAKKKENIRRQVSVFLLSIIGIALMVFWYNTYLKGRISDLKKEIADTKTQIAKYEKINKEIAEIKKKLDLLDTKIGVIETLERNRRLPTQTMDELYKHVVAERMWYTKIQEKKKDILINGIAIDEHTVADYMTRIEKSNLFQNVRLATVKQKVLKNRDLKLKDFSINISREQQKKDDKSKGKK